MLEVTVHSVNDFLQFISRCVKAQKLTIRHVEYSAGLSEGLISRWNKTKSGPRLLNILSLCEFLNIKIILKLDTVQEDDSSGETNPLTVKSTSKPTEKEISSSNSIDEDILSLVRNMLNSSTDLASKKLILDILTSAILLSKH